MIHVFAAARRQRMHLRAITVEVVGRNSFSVWMLLGTSGSWIKEVIDTLECPALARDLVVLVHRVLKLDI